MPYDSSLSSEKDRVRFYIGDVDPSNENLSDAEIEATLGLSSLTGEAKVFDVSVICLSSILSRWTSKTGGLGKIDLEGLEGEVGSDVKAIIEGRISELQKRANGSKKLYFRA